MQIKENLQNILAAIPENVNLIAVSKTKPVPDIMEAYNAGQRIFGENKIQEMAEKHTLLPKDIQWHMIGHLQRNKVKYIAPFINLIHGVDNIKLLKEINKQGKKNDRIIDCLIQVKISFEESKFGLDYKQANEWLTTDLLIDFKNIRITGFMGMASNTNNELKLIEEFSTLNSFFNKHQNTNIKILSMGMSNDYLLAIKNGSNMIRVGSNIFGARK